MNDHPIPDGGASEPNETAISFEDLEWVMKKINEIEAHAEEAKSRASAIAGIAYHVRALLRAPMR